MLTGVYAARNIAGADHDIWSVNVEKDYHEETKTSTTIGSSVSTGNGDRLVPMPIGPEEILPDEWVEEAFASLDPVALGSAVGIVGGLSVFLATVLLLLKGGEMVGPNLSLIGQFFLGFKVSWSGACFGLIQAGVAGFGLGYLGARLRNWGIIAYASFLRRRAAAAQRRSMLEQV